MIGALALLLAVGGIAAAWVLYTVRADRRHAREMYRAGRSVAFLRERVDWERVYEQPTEVLPVATGDPPVASLPHRIPGRVRPYAQRPADPLVDSVLLRRVLTGLQNLPDTAAPAEEPKYPTTDPDAY
ncbi:hypothetical protein ABZU76_34055 [Amycolatopsis sp. NPDC005232]|uniref:hypothetical protein n=1 Tax=Amycolatopsis sp. NPDC005232 TaxID=3157027 RepID=UPI0033BC7D7D